MSLSTVHVDHAGREDTDAVSAVLVDAAEWMAAHKRALWSAASLGPDFVAPYLANRELLAARWNGEIVGVALLLWRDLEFWPDHDDDRSGYIHKLAVRRRVAGQGVSNALVEGAARAAKANGRDLLRLDCDLELCPLYERLGFIKLDQVTIQPPDRASFVVARYQKPITEDRHDH